MPIAALLDIDGTLVDTNYQHTLTWQRALAEHGRTVPAWTIHRHIGMGGDQIVAAVAGDEAEERDGDEIRAAEGEHYQRLIGEVKPLPGARELLVALRDRGHSLVLASSAKTEEVEFYLDLLEARDLVDDWTTSADVVATKPEPDLVVAALEKSSGDADGAVLLGDSIWDCRAAGRAGIPVVGLLTGGFGERELRDAGAMDVYESAAELVERIHDSPFGRQAA
jgi:HAD superfamily hydrolase (TIGR01509 family)